MLVPTPSQPIPLRASSRRPVITTIQQVRRGERDGFRFVASNPASNASSTATAIHSPRWPTGAGPSRASKGTRPNAPGKRLRGQTRADCCVVVIKSRVAVAAVEPLGMTPGGENVQPVSLGSMLVQLSKTTWLKPLVGVAVTV